MNAAADAGGLPGSSGTDHADLPAPLPSSRFWHGRRVLLTGHTGFKGSWAALWLKELGADVTGFSLAPDTVPALFDMAGIENLIPRQIGDLRDRASVAAAVAAADPQVVLHMAAQPIVRRAIAEPIETLASNILGTAHLLDALRRVQGLETVLVVTSDKVYANTDEGRPFAEGDRLGGKDPYSASKAATELVTQSFAATYFADRGVRCVTARGGNVVGGGDYAVDRIVPDIVRAAGRDEVPVLRMPKATRPWQHVLDCVCGYLLFLEAISVDRGNALPSALNFGPVPGRDVDVATLAEAILIALGRPSRWVYDPPAVNKEMKALAVESTLARERLGWRDRLAGERLIAWTADWYKAVHLGADARAVTLRQIHDYHQYDNSGTLA